MSAAALSSSITSIVSSASSTVCGACAPTAPLFKALGYLKTVDTKIDLFIKNHHFGFVKKMSADWILKIAHATLSHVADLNDLIKIKSPYSLISYPDIGSVLIDKTAINARLFFIFDAFSWKGAAKTVKMGIQIGSEIKPVGFSFLIEHSVNLYELYIRSHPIIAQIAPAIFFNGGLSSPIDFFCHEFTHYGSASCLVKAELSLKNRFSLAKQFIEQLIKLHTIGVHGDLHIENLVCGKTDDEYFLKINDFGCFKPKKGVGYFNPKIMTTSGRHLSKDILERCKKEIGFYQWEKSFDAKMTLIDWELLEKFQAGVILIYIFTGRHPWDMLLEKLKPHFFQKLEEYSEISDKLNFIKPFLSDKDYEEVWNIYFTAFHQFYWERLFTTRDDIPYNRHNMRPYKDGFIGGKLVFCPYEITFKDPEDFDNLSIHEAYTDLFETYFNHPEKIKELDLYLTSIQKIRIEQILVACDDKIKKSYRIDDEYPRLLLELSEPISAYENMFIAHVPVKLQDLTKSMIKIVLPLLNDEPSARPSLEKVLEDLCLLKESKDSKP